MKKTFLFILSLLLCSSCYATTYYVRATGGNDGNTGLSYAQAWATSLYATLQLSPGDTLKYDGDFSERLYTRAAGTAEAWITLEAYDYNDKPSFTYSTDETCFNEHQYYNIKGFKFYNTGAYDPVLIRNPHCYMEQCEIYAGDTSPNALSFNRTTLDDIKVSKCLIYGGASKSIQVSAYLATGTLDFYLNKVYGYSADSDNNTVQFYGIPQAVYRLYNNDFIGARGSAINIANASSTGYIKNNIIHGYGLADVNATGISLHASSAVVYDYNLISCNSTNYAKTVTGGVDGGHNLIGSQYFPEITSYPYVGKISLFNDDYVDHAETQAGIANTYGLPLSACISYIFNKDEEDLTTRLDALIAAGNEIVNHGYNHVYLQETEQGTLTYSGGDSNPAVDVDQTGYEIVLTTTEGNDDLTVTEINTKDVDDLQAALSGSNWSYASNYRHEDTEPLSSLADTDGSQALTAGEIELSYDLDAFFDNEIDATSTWIEANTTDYTVKTLAYPYWVGSADTIDGLIGAGLIAARKGAIAFGFDLKYMDIYEVNGPYITGLIGDETETEMKNMMKQLARATACGPALVGITTHILGVSNDPTAEGYGWMCEQLAQESEFVTVDTFSAHAEAVIDSGDWTDVNSDTKIWKRTDFTDNSDFTLQSLSPCINAGVDVGLTEDFEGNPIVGAPDIGAYEYQPIDAGSDEFILWHFLRK